MLTVRSFPISHSFFYLFVFNVLIHIVINQCKILNKNVSYYLKQIYALLNVTVNKCTKEFKFE